MSSVPEPNNNNNTNNESSEGGNVIPTNAIPSFAAAPDTQQPEETPRKFKNPETIEELKEMRTQLKKDEDLKRKVKIEYKKKVQLEAQGLEYSPPDNLKQFKILQPKNLRNFGLGDLVSSQNDTSTKDISDQVFEGEKK